MLVAFDNPAASAVTFEVLEQIEKTGVHGPAKYAAGITFVTTVPW